MRRRLWLLNLALIGLLILIGYRFQSVREDARQRAARNLNVRVQPEKAQPLPRIAPVKPVVIANYADVAIKTLFAPDRNPTVILDPVAPPPEKPMPPLPVAYGTMFLGEPGIILGVANRGQRNYHKGEDVGDFKLLDFDRQRVVFVWEGKTVEKRMDEILAKPGSAAEKGANAQTASAAPAQALAGHTVTTISGTGGPEPPGIDVGGGHRTCAPDDPAPNGSMKNGYRKVEAMSPFGKTCRWEKVDQQ